MRPMKNTLPEVDAYIERSADFARPVLTKLRRLFHHACPEIEESIKWSSPFFEYKGIVGNMTAFKKHVSYGFWKASLMTDPAGLLERAGNSQMAVLKASTVDDLPADAILIRYIEEAVDFNEKGVKVPRTIPIAGKRALEIPGYFMAALKKDKRALVTFEGFSHSNRRDYVEWVTDAKREATRDRRLATAVEWLSEGKPRNWKYMEEYR